MEGFELSAKPDGSPQLELCPGPLAIPAQGTTDFVFRRGHEFFDYVALGEFFGAARRGVSEQAERRRSTPAESQTKYRNEYGRA